MQNAVISLGQAALCSAQLMWRALAWLTGAEGRRRRQEAEAERRLVLKGAQPVAASTDFSQLRPSTIYAFGVTDRHAVLVGTLKLWFKPQSRVFCRDFTFSNETVRDAFGARNLPLKPVRLAPGDTVAALREASLQEVERVLKKRLMAGAGDVLPEAAKGAQAPPAVAAQPAAKAAAQASMPSNSGFGDESSAARSLAAKRAHGARIHSLDEGVLLAHGVASRTLGQGEAKRAIQQFYVDLRLTNGETVGVVKRIWGADLERALEEGQIKQDMLVSVAFLGRTRVDGGEDGTPSFKNLYQVTQIGGRK